MTSRALVLAAIFALGTAGCSSATGQQKPQSAAKTEQVRPVTLPDIKMYGLTLRDVDAGGTLKGQYRGKTLHVATKVNELKNGLAAVIPYFEQVSGAEVKLDVFSDDTFVKAISDDLESGHRYDVVLMPVAFMHSFEQSGYIQELTPFVTNRDIVDPNLDLDDFIPSIMDTYGYYHGKLYSLPYKPDAQILFYRKDLFEDPVIQEQFLSKTGKKLKVPDTIEELYETARFFTRVYNPASPVAYGFNMMGKPGWSRFTFDNRLGAYGGKDVDKDFLPGFRNEAGIRAMQTYKELIQYVPPQFKDFGWEEGNRFFLQGDVAMMEQWPGLSKAAEDANSRIKGKIGYAVVPGVGDTKAPTLGGWSIGIVRNPANPDSSELAYKFIEYVTSRDIELLKIPSGNDPTRISNYKRPEVASANPIYPVLAESLAQAKVLADPDVPFVTSQLNEIEENAVQDVLWNKATPEEAVGRMADSFNKVIGATGLGQ